jgi:hypothetical protein
MQVEDNDSSDSVIHTASPLHRLLYCENGTAAGLFQLRPLRPVMRRLLAVSTVSSLAKR